VGGDGSATAASPAEVYEDFLVRWQFRPWTAALLAEAALRPSERVLDLAAGTGVVAREVAPFVGSSGRVVALDVNPAMLVVGRALPAPVGATIEWIEGDATMLPLPDAAFDVVVCQQGLQYVPDKPAALAEARRVLVPGGRAIFAVWQSIARNPVANALNEALRRQIGVGPLAGPYGQGDPQELREHLTEAGFTRVSVTPRELIVVFPSRGQFVRQAIESRAQLVPELAAMNAAERADLARGIEEEVAAALVPFAWGDGIAAPMATNLAAGRA
jgi:ubiquinone/menaquinone biosynthesis C-methylase UbiE